MVIAHCLKMRGYLKKIELKIQLRNSYFLSLAFPPRNSINSSATLALLLLPSPPHTRAPPPLGRRPAPPHPSLSSPLPHGLLPLTTRGGGARVPPKPVAKCVAEPPLSPFDLCSWSLPPLKHLIDQSLMCWDPKIDQLSDSWLDWEAWDSSSCGEQVLVHLLVSQRFWSSIGSWLKIRRLDRGWVDNQGRQEA